MNSRDKQQGEPVRPMSEPCESTEKCWAKHAGYCHRAFTEEQVRKMWWNCPDFASLTEVLNVAIRDYVRQQSAPDAEPKCKNCLHERSSHSRASGFCRFTNTDFTMRCHCRGFELEPEPASQEKVTANNDALLELAIEMGMAYEAALEDVFGAVAGTLMEIRDELRAIAEELRKK